MSFYFHFWWCCNKHWALATLTLWSAPLRSAMRYPPPPLASSHPHTASATSPPSYSSLTWVPSATYQCSLGSGSSSWASAPSSLLSPISLHLLTLTPQMKGRFWCLRKLFVKKVDLGLDSLPWTTVSCVDLKHVCIKQLRPFLSFSSLCPSYFLVLEGPLSWHWELHTLTTMLTSMFSEKYDLLQYKYTLTPFPQGCSVPLHQCGLQHGCFWPCAWLFPWSGLPQVQCWLLLFRHLCYQHSIWSMGWNVVGRFPCDWVSFALYRCPLLHLPQAAQTREKEVVCSDFNCWEAASDAAGRFHVWQKRKGEGEQLWQEPHWLTNECLAPVDQSGVLGVLLCSLHGALRHLRLCLLPAKVPRDTVQPEQVRSEHGCRRNCHSWGLPWDPLRWLPSQEILPWTPLGTPASNGVERGLLCLLCSHSFPWLLKPTCGRHHCALFIHWVSFLIINVWTNETPCTVSLIG